jgi:hypothetical protein
MFSPPTTYQIIPESVKLEDFHKYAEEYVVRPPYQRKSVWSRKKKLALLDSMFRGFYIPRIVMREVALGPKQAVHEIIDGQQRITVAQEFYANELRLPKTLEDLDPALPGRRYKELSSEIRRFVDKIAYAADLVTGIDDPKNPEHQKVAAEIFWRLQQGETLTFMEIAHARLSSLARNFVVKYGDDVNFDYDTYRPVDENPHKHRFFQIYDRPNNRMQHMALLARLLLLEESGGAADIKDSNVKDLIERTQSEDGIGNDSYETTDTAKRTLSDMRAFYDVFKDDPAVADGSGMPEFRIEYFVVSMYLLLRHLRRNYIVDDRAAELFRKFVYEFHTRWKARREDDNVMLVFSDHRQQTASDVEVRQRIVRQLFFEYATGKDVELLAKDTRRAFSEAERIRLYRDQGGLCQECLRKGCGEKEALVPWSEYEADHVIPHAKGGETSMENAELLCRAHNRTKGARVSA